MAPVSTTFVTSTRRCQYCPHNFLPLVKSWNYSHFWGNWGWGWYGTADLWSESNLLPLWNVRGWDTLRLVMKSHSPQVGPDFAKLLFIWHHHCKGGLSFPSPRLPSFCHLSFLCFQTWQPVSHERVLLIQPLTYRLHALFALQKGRL